ncbi:MAG: hypothetical protein QG670_2580 [Thermoproteota archaeon]|nr:hypothetical protein [Thermoproteota archaeon]
MITVTDWLDNLIKKSLLDAINEDKITAHLILTPVPLDRKRCPISKIVLDIHLDQTSEMNIEFNRELNENLIVKEDP